MKESLFSTKILFLVLFVCIQTNAQRPFIGIWTSSLYEQKWGETPNEQVKIYLEGSYTYTWQHTQKPETNGSGSGTDILHLTFPERGGYRISFTPTGKNPLHRIYPYIVPKDSLSTEKHDKTDALKLTKIEQWGDVKWSTMKEAFK